jgi:DNA-binding transcriptional regulator/RsmH inhibitor MraZ
MKNIKVNIDDEGRLQLPSEIRKELGNNLTLKKTQEGYILSSKGYVTNEALRKIINSKHRRTGKPQFATPKEMKSIWKTAEE